MTGSVAASLAIIWVLGSSAALAEEGVDWPMSRRGPTNQASIQLETAEKDLPRAWTFSLDRHVWGFLPGMTVFSSPALSVVDGQAVIAFGAYDNNVYLRSAITGAEL